jgi:hypothetical protein
MSAITMRRLLSSVGMVIITIGAAIPAMGWLLPRAETHAAPQALVADVSLEPEVAGDVASPLTTALASSATAHFAGPPFYHFGDVNHDGKTDLTDFSIIKANFGKMNAVVTDGDVTGDMLVGLDDFSVLKKWFGAMSPFIP